MNIKELKELIKDLPDSLEVKISYWETPPESTGWEKRSSINYGRKIHETEEKLVNGKWKKVQEQYFLLD